MKRIAWLITGLFIIILTLFLTQEPILEAMGSFLVVQDDLKKSDVIIVLSGQIDRVDEAVRLYERGLAGYIIMTGRTFDKKVSMAEVMKRQAVALGVPSESIILEPEAMSTYQHPGLVKPIMQVHGFRSAIVISSPYHMRRAAMLFNRSFRRSGIELIYYPVQESWFKVKGWWKNAGSRKAVRLEYMKMSVNFFGNRVSEFVDNSINAYLED